MGHPVDRPVGPEIHMLNLPLTFPAYFSVTALRELQGVSVNANFPESCAVAS